MVNYCWLCSVPIALNSAVLLRPLYDRHTGKKAGVVMMHVPCGDKLNYFLSGYKKHSVLQYIKFLEANR